MSRKLPFLALDSAGNRTILNDYSLPMSGGKVTIKKETKKMRRTMTASDAAAYGALFIKNRAVANKFWAKCMGQDAAMDDETTEKLKEFLKTKLSPGDHAQVCDMIEAAGGEAEANDDLPENAIERSPAKRGSAGVAADAAFNAKFPGLAHIRIDTSGIAIPKRAASYSNAGAKSFAERYPGLAHIRQG